VIVFVCATYSSNENARPRPSTAAWIDMSVLPAFLKHQPTVIRSVCETLRRLLAITLIVAARRRTMAAQSIPSTSSSDTARPTTMFPHDDSTALWSYRLKLIARERPMHLWFSQRVCGRRMTTTRAVLLGLFLSAACTHGQQNHAGADMHTSTKRPDWTREHGGVAVHADAWFDHYRFRSGEVLPRVRIHYATLGSPHRNAQGHIDNAVLVLHWTGADGDALLGPHYMEALFAPGRPLDATRYFLIFPDSVGHGQSSKPSDGLKAGFPKYGYADMVDLQHRLVTEKLGIAHLRAILGMSMGGMNAWQWAEVYPDAMDGVMPVVSVPMPISGRNLLWRRIVIDAIRSDPQWNRGNYTSPPHGWLNASPLIGMMLDSVLHLQALVPDGSAADRFVADARRQAVSIDANDILSNYEVNLRCMLILSPRGQIRHGRREP
jgi:homoserine O-acetyltransferase